jgi:flagellar assembly protein FliH
MASVIKFDSLAAGTSIAMPLAFNVADVQSRAEQYLTEVQQQASQLLEQARQEAEKIKQQARQQAIQAAQAEVQQQIQQRAAELTDQRCKTAIAGCQQTVQQLTESMNEWLTQWRDQTIQLAARMADKLVRSQMQDNNELLRVWMEEAISALRDARELRVLVHPDDFAVAGRFLQSLMRSASPSGQVEVLPDPNVKPGGCIVKSSHGQIDQQLESQLMRLTEQLSQ